MRVGLCSNNYLSIARSPHHYKIAKILAPAWDFSYNEDYSSSSIANMSMRYLWWAGLIGASTAIPLVQTVALAKKVPATEIASFGKTITVRISGSENTGSGAIVQKQGDVYTVLTAAHVLKQNNYTIYTPDDRQHQIISGSIRKATKNDIDLAVFKFKASANYPVAKLGDCNKGGYI